MLKYYTMIRQEKKCRKKLRFKKRYGNRKRHIINQRLFEKKRTLDGYEN